MSAVRNLARRWLGSQELQVSFAVGGVLGMLAMAALLAAQKSDHSEDFWK